MISDGELLIEGEIIPQPDIEKLLRERLESGVRDIVFAADRQVKYRHLDGIKRWLEELGFEEVQVTIGDERP